MYHIELPKLVRTRSVLGYFEVMLDCKCLFSDGNAAGGIRYVYMAPCTNSNGNLPSMKRFFHLYVPTKSPLVLPHHNVRSLALEPLYEVDLPIEVYKEDLEFMARMEEKGFFPRFEEGAIVF